MENRNIEELANNFVFRYVSNSKHFNIDQLIKIIKYPTNNMILDVITRSNKLEPLKFTPLVIDFDVIGKLIFFVLVIMLYYFIFTKAQIKNQKVGELLC